MEKCSDHGRNAEMYCQDCDRSVCAECALSWMHRGHNVALKDSLSREHDAFLKNFGKSLASLGQILSDILKTQVSDLQARKVDLLQEMGNKFGWLRGEILKIEKQCEEILEGRFLAEESRLEIYKRQVTDLQRDLKEGEKEFGESGFQIKGKTGLESDMQGLKESIQDLMSKRENGKVFTLAVRVDIISCKLISRYYANVCFFLIILYGK